jgi:tetratricopeptide (TPR) repeat protein
LDVLEDLLRLSNNFDPILLERTMMIDTNPERIKAYFLETKGVYFLSRGEPEAAAAMFRQISPVEQARMTQFVPFANRFGEKINREPPRETALNRLEIVEQLIEFEQQGKAAAALQDTNEAKIWLRLGDFWYNTSFFGYEWEVRDFHRDGANQGRLAHGPVFPLEGAPDGNRENLDLDLALQYYEKAYKAARTQEMKARAAFMAARVQQKQWFCHPDCTYRPGNPNVPLLPAEYMNYYDLLITRHSKTRYFETVIKECKWLAAYAR